MLRKSLLNMINRWSVHPIQKKKRYFLLHVSLAKTKIIPLRNPPPGEPRSNSQPSWDSWSQCRAWCTSGMDLTLCPWRRQACQMIKAIYHLHSLKASDVMKPLWFLELREVCDGFPRILFSFRQPSATNTDHPFLCYHFCKHLAIQTFKDTDTDTVVSKHFGFVTTLHLCFLVTFT